MASIIKADTLQSTTANVFVLNSSGTEYARFDSSGNMGIGTATPSAPLDVKVGVGNFTIGLQGAGNAQLTASGALRFNTTSGTTLFAQNDTESMRIDSSGNLLFNSGYGSAATAYGCRAWVNFNGQGVVAIRASGNVTSITDNGTGDYTVNFTTAMPDADYVTTGTSSGSDTPANNVAVVNTKLTSGLTTSACRLYITNASGAAADRAFIAIAIFR